MPPRKSAEAPGKKRPGNCKCRIYLGKDEHEEGCPARKSRAAITNKSAYTKFEQAKARPPVKQYETEDVSNVTTLKPKEQTMTEVVSSRMDQRYTDELAAADELLARAELAVAQQKEYKDHCKKALEETPEAEALTAATKALKAAEELEMSAISATKKIVRSWREGRLTFADHSPGFAAERNCDNCGILSRETKAAPKDGERWCVACMQDTPVEQNWFVNPAAV